MDHRHDFDFWRRQQAIENLVASDLARLAALGVDPPESECHCVTAVEEFARRHGGDPAPVADRADEECPECGGTGRDVEALRRHANQWEELYRLNKNNDGANQ